MIRVQHVHERRKENLVKEFILKHAFTAALTVCMVGTLFATLSFAGSAQAATTHAANPTISCPGQTLPLGYTWYTGNVNTWTACSGRQLKLIDQTDGNFVLYCNGNAIWATNTNNVNVSPDYIELQYDGNLVLYVTYGVNGQPGWASGTYGEGATHMQLQGDANLVIYNGTHALWASNTRGKC